MEKTCCITGHRNIPAGQLDYVRRELAKEIDAALADGFRTFVTGFAPGVDLLFAELVLERQDEHPGLFLEAALPFAGRMERLTRDEQELLAACHGVKILCERYTRGCFFLRNRYMVHKSSRIIAVYDGRSRGGTRYTINCAKALDRQLRIIRL